MQPLQAHALLQDACKILERLGDHAIAAHVSYAMALITQTYGVGEDHMPVEEQVVPRMDPTEAAARRLEIDGG